MIEDAELLRRYAEDGSEDAFADLVRRRVGLVYSVARRQVAGDAHLAEEVTLRVFADLARKAGALARRRVLSGWLCRAAQFAASDAVRAERRRKEREAEIRIMHELMSDSSTAPDWEKIRGVLDQSMSQLGERDRDAVALRFYEGRSLAEVGARLRLSEDAARMRIERALDKLHALLARHGVTSTTAALAMVLTNQAAGAVPAGLAANVTSSALAGAGSGGVIAAVVNFLHSMTTTKATTSITVPLAILAVGTASYEVAANHEVNALVASATESHTGVLRTLEDLNQRGAVAGQELARLKKEMDDAMTARAAASVQAPWDPATEGAAFLARHIDYRQAVIDRAKARTASTFRRMYRTLGLTPGQIERFEELQLEGVGVNAATPDGPLQMKLGQGLTPAEVHDQLRILLGAVGYVEYQNERRLGPARQLLTQLASGLAFTDSPLTSQQAGQVLAVIDELHAGVNSDANRDGNPMETLAKLDPDTVAARARGHLAESQAILLREFLVRHRQSQGFGEAMHRMPERTGQ